MKALFDKLLKWLRSHLNITSAKPLKHQNMSFLWFVVRRLEPNNQPYDSVSSWSTIQPYGEHRKDGQDVLPLTTTLKDHRGHPIQVGRPIRIRFRVRALDSTSSPH